MERTDPQFKLRIPATLKAQLDAAAKNNRRSLTAEIVMRLETTLEIEEQLREIRFSGSLEDIHDFIDALTLQSSAPAGPARSSLLMQLYQETSRRVAELEAAGEPNGMADKVELEHERETAKYLRHAVTRALLAEQEKLQG